MSILEKIKKAKEIFLNEEDSLTLQKWEQEVKTAIALSGIMKTEAVKLIINKFNEDIEGINDILLNDEELAEDDRKLLFAKRNWTRRIVDIFTRQDSRLKKIEKEIDESLT